MEQVHEAFTTELTSPRTALSYYVTINPFNAPCLPELGFLSLAVKCLLTNVPLFMELEEKTRKKEIKANLVF